MAIMKIYRTTSSVPVNYKSIKEAQADCVAGGFTTFQVEKMPNLIATYTFANGVWKAPYFVKGLGGVLTPVYSNNIYSATS